jgi:hypothetical protein
MSPFFSLTLVTACESIRPHNPEQHRQNIGKWKVAVLVVEVKRNSEKFLFVRVGGHWKENGDCFDGDKVSREIRQENIFLYEFTAHFVEIQIHHLPKYRYITYWNTDTALTEIQIQHLPKYWYNT